MPAATWIAHVKSVYAKGNMTYKEAKQRAAKTWKKSKGAKAAPARKSRGRKRKTKDEPEDAEWMFVAQRLMPDGLDPVSWDRRGWGVTPKQPHLGAPQVWITGSGAISYAESVLGFVKAHELGPIVGGATAGANGNINPFELPGGYSITWTGMKVLHHDGSQLHLRGIEPTHPVHTTLDGLRLGRDEQLDKAVELVRATSNAGPM